MADLITSHRSKRHLMLSLGTVFQILFHSSYFRSRKLGRVKIYNNLNSKMNNIGDKITIPREYDEEQHTDFSKIKENCSLFLLNPAAPQVPSWPNDVVMYTPECYQIILPDYANCLAVKTYLKMGNLNYDVIEKENAEFMSPTFNVPFIKVEKTIVSELDGIINFLNNRNIKLTEKLDTDQKINLKAFMSLVPSVIYLCELYITWIHKQTYETITRPKYSCIYPWPLNWIQAAAKRKQMIKKLEVFQWSNKSLDDVLIKFESCCEALNNRLNGKTQFFEGHDTELDALVFGHLYAISSTILPGNYLRDIVNKYPDLLHFIIKIRERYT